MLALSCKSKEQERGKSTSDLAYFYTASFEIYKMHSTLYVMIKIKDNRLELNIYALHAIEIYVLSFKGSGPQSG